MILYHGSPNKFSNIRKSQAQAGRDMSLPKGELLNAIYLTPNIEFAIAVASMPEGATHIDSKNKTIEFEFPKHFDPDKKIYIYEIDSANFPENIMQKIDDEQYAIVDLDEIKPDKIHELRAKETLKYYTLIEKA